MITRYGRKFFLAVAVMAAAIVLRAVDLIGVSELVTLLLGGPIAFMLSNTAQDFAPKAPT